MPLNLPINSQEIEDQIKADVAKNAPESNPYLPNHWLLALIIGLSRRLFDNDRNLQRGVDFCFPDTTFDNGITRWASVLGKSQNAATQSTGNSIATGTATTIVLSETILTTTIINEDGENVAITFESTDNATITDNIIDVISINLSGQTATVITVDEHELSNNVPVTISGANEPEYNVTDIEIVVINSTTFTYEIVGSPSSPATGTIISSYTSALVPIKSINFGADNNLSANTPLTLQSPIIGVNNIFGLDANGTTGGFDQESLNNLKVRYLQKFRNPVAHFNENDIVSEAQEINGVGRVFVQAAGTLIESFSITSLDEPGSFGVALAVSATPHGLFSGDYTTIQGAVQAGYNVVNGRVLIIDDTNFSYIVPIGLPTATGTITGQSNIPLGSVRVYFITNDDEDIIPSAELITKVRDQILTILPATTSELDLVVLAPIALPQDFVFTELIPNTLTMQTSVTNNLIQFFSERTDVGVNVDEDAYRAAIIDTIDIENGERLQSFELSLPVGDISVGNGELATFNTATYPLI